MYFIMYLYNWWCEQINVRKIILAFGYFSNNYYAENLNSDHIRANFSLSIYLVVDHGQWTVYTFGRTKPNTEFKKDQRLSYCFGC